MRAVALLLIVVNLGYLGWSALIDAPATLLPTSVDPSAVPRLVLASERVPSQVSPNKKSLPRTATKSALNTNETISDSSAQKCVSLGPFQDLPTVVEASAIMKGAGYEPRQRLEQGELWVGYWVSIPGSTTHEQAERATTKLKDKGIVDAYILPGMDSGNVISLGVFKEHERAQRRMNEAKSLGFNATMADRTRAGSVYWVDIDVKNGGQTIDTSILGSQPGKIMRLESRPCKANDNQRVDAALN
jgi:hypothetical protein